MEKLIVIDSCMREESRTKVILDAAREVLSARYEIETIDVNALALPCLRSVSQRPVARLLRTAPFPM